MEKRTRAEHGTAHKSPAAPDTGSAACGPFGEERLATFANAVVQEMRTPLRHVEAFSQLLRQRSEQWDEESQRYLSALLDGVAEMRGFLESLLRFCRASQKPLQGEALDLSALAAKILARLHRLERHRSVQIRVAPNLKVYADPELCELLLTSLLENAWKFTRGTRSAHIEVGPIPDADPVTFFVRDSGVGFPAEKTDLLFRPLSRLHSRHEYEGAGFGLAIAALVARRHGGGITAKGTVGGGATFIVTIPSSSQADD